MSLDSVLALLKRWQRRFHFADYADLDRYERWKQLPADAPFRERVFPVAIPKDEMRRILVFKPDDIGDAVCSLPAIAELAAWAPDAKLYLVCQSATAPIFERTGLFHQICAVDVTTRFLRFRSFPVKKALSYFDTRDFDLAIFLRTYPSLFRSFRKIPAKRWLHPLDPRLPSTSIHQARVSQWGEERAHQALQLLEIVGALTGRKYDFADVRFPRLAWKDEDRIEMPERLGVIHPFCREETRRYPMEHWRALVAKLTRSTDFPWVIVGGKEDAPIEGLTGVRQLQGKLTLAQTAWLLSKATAFVGVDSGPAHLAGALGAPTVVIKGGHNLTREWSPLGRTLCLRADVPCAPCHRRVCPGYGLKCLTELTPDRIFPEIASFLRPPDRRLPPQPERATELSDA